MLVPTGGFESELETTDPQAVRIAETVTARKKEIARIILFSLDEQADRKYPITQTGESKQRISAVTDVLPRIPTGEMTEVTGGAGTQVVALGLNPVCPSCA